MLSLLLTKDCSNLFSEIVGIHVSKRGWLAHRVGGAGSRVAVKPYPGMAVLYAVCAAIGRLGACKGRALLSSSSLQYGLDSPVFLTSRGSCFHTVLPGVMICSSVHPAGCFEVALDGVFEALQKSTSSMCAVAQFFIENLLWQALRLHAVDMSKPAAASLNKQRGYA